MSELGQDDSLIQGGRSKTTFMRQTLMWSKKSQNLVNVVCERPLTLSFTAIFGNKLTPGYLFLFYECPSNPSKCIQSKIE